MSNTKKILWKPKDSYIEKTQYFDFCKYLRKNNIFDCRNVYDKLWEWSIAEPESFWSSLWDWHGIIGYKGKILSEQKNIIPGSNYFPDAKINFTENLLFDADESISIITHSEDRRNRKISRKELLSKVLSLAGWMKKKGVKKGDRVVAYLPNSEIAIISMLATASLGAIFSSCSPDFGFSGVMDRFSQINPKLLISVDGYSYNGKKISKIETIIDLEKNLPTLENILIAGYLEKKPDISYISKSSVFEETFKSHPIKKFTRIAFNDPLYIMYSSGTTGRPKCILHSVGGTLIQHIKEHKIHCNIFNNDVMFFFTTCGWMMWNWLVTGLASKASIMLYEGNPFFPSIDRLWKIIERENVKLFGASAKYFDALKKSKFIPRNISQYNDLKIICSTGSPLSEESFKFVYEKIKCDVHLASISGGTDILCCFVLGCPILPVFEGEIQVRGLGMDVVILDEDGNEIKNQKGELCCKNSFPSMPIKFWRDIKNKKYLEAYFNKYKNIWRHGDWATLTKNNGIIIHGRSDATLNPSGVRIGTSEIYRIVESLDAVNESLVVGQDIENDVRIILFLKLEINKILNNDLIEKIKNKIKAEASPRHVPSVICQVNDIPRTRSGKITELAVRDIIHGKSIKNTEALENPECLDEYKNREELQI